MKPLKAEQEEFEAMELFGIPCLFTQYRIDRSTVPECLYAYDLRHGDDDSEPCSVENHVTVNFFGTVLTAAAIEWPGMEDHRPVCLDDWSFMGAGDIKVSDYIRMFLNPAGTGSWDFDEFWNMVYNLQFFTAIPGNMDISEGCPYAVFKNPFSGMCMKRDGNPKYEEEEYWLRKTEDEPVEKLIKLAELSLEEGTDPDISRYPLKLIPLIPGTDYFGKISENKNSFIWFKKA